MTAPQEFRDGCAYAAQVIVDRVQQAKRIGIPVTIENVEHIAKEFSYEMGGYVDKRTYDLVNRSTT